MCPLSPRSRRASVLYALTMFHYALLVAPQLRLNDFVTSDGYDVALVRAKSRGWRFPAHSHEFVEVLCVVTGAGIQHLDDEPGKALAPGMIATILPGRTHSLRAVPDVAPLTFINVVIPHAIWVQVFSTIRRDPWLRGSSASTMVYPDEDARTNTNRALFQELLSSAPDDQSLPKLLRFLLDLVDGYDLAEPSPDGSEWLQRILGAVETEEVIRDGLPLLLSRLNISYSHLARLCRLHAGATPTEVVNRARIDRAKQLLATSPMPVTAVGQRCGFGTTSHFYKVFRRVTGTTPGAFRVDLVKALSPSSRPG